MNLDKKLKELPKKTKLILILSIIAIILLFFLNIKSQNIQLSTPTNSPIIVTNKEYKDISLGQATKDIVYSKLGAPLEEKVTGVITSSEFKSNNPNFNNELKFESDKLTFVKEIIAPIDNVDIKKMEDKYGKFDVVLYPPNAGIYSGLFIYLDKGIAYRGNYFTGDLTEVWYFIPSDLNQFKSKYASDYLDKPEIGQ